MGREGMVVDEKYRKGMGVDEKYRVKIKKGE